MQNKQIFTLAFIKLNRSILMGYKTRGLGKGLWNGFGGKLEESEAIEDAALREIKEECNLDVSVSDLTHLGVVEYEVEGRELLHVVHVFTCGKFSGDVAASEEMNPVRWFPEDKLPHGEMWPCTKHWYPYMLGEKYFYALIRYDGDVKEIVMKNIKEFQGIDEVLQYCEKKRHTSF